MGQKEAVYIIPKFTFEAGGVLENMKVGYVTFGKLNAAKDDAILVVPGTSGNRHSSDSLIGPGKTFDTDKYFVIGVDPIGGGNSSSPKDRLGIAFPKYNIQDLVRAQHELPSIKGHLACCQPPGTVEYAFVSERTKAFLDDLAK